MPWSQRLTVATAVVLLIAAAAQQASASAAITPATRVFRFWRARRLLEDESQTDQPFKRQSVAPLAPGSTRSPSVSETWSSGTDNSKLPPLIPLPVLLGPAQYKSPQLSPDGKFLAYLAPSEGAHVTQVFVAALPPSRGSTDHTSSSSKRASSSSSSSSSDSFSATGSSSDADADAAVGVPLSPVQVTNTSAAVSDLFWSRDGAGILFTIDSGAGTEDFQLHWVPLSLQRPAGATSNSGSSSSSKRGDGSSSGSSGRDAPQGPAIKAGAPVNLTPGKGVKAQGLWLSYADPRRAYVGTNKRTKSVFDFFSLDLKTHALTLHTINPGNVTTWVVTAAFELGAAVMAGPDGSRTLVVRDTNTADGCPASSAAAADGSKHKAQHTPKPATGQQQQQQQPQVAVSKQSTQQQQQQHQAGLEEPPGGNRRLLGLAEQRGLIGDFMWSGSGEEGLLLSAAAAAGSGSEVVAAADGSGDGSDGSNSGNSENGGGSDHKGSGSSAGDKARDVAAAIGGSSSRSNVACWRRVYEWPLGDEGRVWGFNKAGDGLYITTSVGRDTTELQLISTSPNKPGAVLERLASHPLVDVNDVIFDVVTRQPEALALDYHKPVWSFRASQDQQEWDRLEAWRPGQVLSPVSRSKDRQVMVVHASEGHHNSAYYLHRRGTFPPQLLFHQQPSLSNYTLARTHPVVITARDGLKIPGYLTLPARSDLPTQLPAWLAGDVPNFQAFNAPQRTHSTHGTSHVLPKQQQQEPAAAAAQEAEAETEQGSEYAQRVDWGLPLVLLVHGGPWKRTSWGSNAPVTQFLANRGYAVLNVNFRGSTGYGKTFTYKGDGQWGVGSMQHDLSDGVEWAVQKGIADRQRVCIQGASYGGYATFAGLAFTPELYKCGLSFAGITDLASFVRAMPPWWEPIKARFLHRVGNVTGNSTLNRRLSPVYHTSNIRVPLLIGQGGNDVRVTKAEAEAMFQGLKRQANKQVQYVLYPNEGHSLTHLPNKLDYYSRAERLLADVLGGRRDAALRSPSKSSAEVRTRRRLVR